MSTEQDPGQDGEPLTFVKRDVSHLPVDERGHRHLYGALDASQHGFVQDGAQQWLDRPEIYSGASSCRWCDAFQAFRIRTEADGVPAEIVATTECPLPRGMTISVDLAVPSGRIIVADNLHPIFDAPMPEDDGGPGYNSVAGQAAYCAAMAAIGCAYGPVGNTSPSLIRTGTDRYVIAAVDDEAEPDEDGYLAGDVLASICTDLHAYSIADYETWLARVRTWAAAPARRDPDDWDRLGLIEWVATGADPAGLPWHVGVVDLPPGIYRFTHHTGESGFDRDGDWPLVFADIEKIG